MEVKQWNRDKVLTIIMLFSCKESSSSAWVILSHMDPVTLKKEYSHGVNLKKMVLNLVLFIYITFSTTGTSEPYALWAVF